MWAKSEMPFFSMRKIGVGNDSPFVQEWGKMLQQYWWSCTGVLKENWS